jgi:hypothetical protein
MKRGRKLLREADAIALASTYVLHKIGRPLKVINAVKRATDREWSVEFAMSENERFVCDDSSKLIIVDWTTRECRTFDEWFQDKHKVH